MNLEVVLTWQEKVTFKLLFSKPGPFEGEGFASILAQISGVNLPLAPPVPTSLWLLLLCCQKDEGHKLSFRDGFATTLHLWSANSPWNIGVSSERWLNLLRYFHYSISKTQKLFQLWKLKWKVEGQWFFKLKIIKIKPLHIQSYAQYKLFKSYTVCKFKRSIE